MAFQLGEDHDSGIKDEPQSANRHYVGVNDHLFGHSNSCQPIDSINTA